MMCFVPPRVTSSSYCPWTFPHSASCLQQRVMTTRSASGIFESETACTQCRPTRAWCLLLSLRRRRVSFWQRARTTAPSRHGQGEISPTLLSTLVTRARLAVWMYLRVSGAWFRARLIGRSSCGRRSLTMTQQLMRRLLQLMLT